MAIGELRTEFEAPDEVARVYHEIVQLAETLGRDVEAAVAFSRLAHLSAVMQQQFQAAHRFIALAQAKLARVGDGNVAVRGALLASEGQILADENRLGEAERAMRQSIAMLEQAYGGEHPNVGNAMGTLTQILHAQNKTAEALDAANRTVAILSKALGDDHPTVAGGQMTLAQILTDTGKFADAHDRLIRADAVFARAFGEDHRLRAAIAANLGGLELQQEHWSAAEAHFRHALTILERTHGMVKDGSEVAGTRRDLANALAGAGRMTDALAEQQRAIDILAKFGPEGEPRLVVALCELVEYQLDAKKPKLAVSNAERAYAIASRRADDANPTELAEAKFAFALALWDSGRDRARARKLAVEAQSGTSGAMRTSVDRWLREHP